MGSLEVPNSGNAYGGLAKCPPIVEDLALQLEHIWTVHVRLVDEVLTMRGTEIVSQKGYLRLFV